MKPGKIAFITFFILFLSLVFLVSLAKFGVVFSAVTVIYFLFFEAILLFCITAVMVGCRRSLKV
ncbi:MAG: hypothetical protein JW840_07460 [Candidatus Thermoplasmatota archaeon]|nr:hypothetical protein [Candidatus Thermoplasmatota archaeon]